MPKNLALFLAKNGQKSGSKFKKMAPKNLIGENGGERKINPSANPVIADTYFAQYESQIRKRKTKRDRSLSKKTSNKMYLYYIIYCL